MFYVNLYETSRCYGGPEEGGWWYQSGQYAGTLGDFDSEEIARYEARKYNYNKNKSSGMIAKAETHTGENYPDCKPHYE